MRTMRAKTGPAARNDTLLFLWKMNWVVFLSLGKFGSRGAFVGPFFYFLVLGSWFFSAVGLLERGAVFLGSIEEFAAV